MIYRIYRFLMNASNLKHNQVIWIVSLMSIALIVALFVISKLASIPFLGWLSLTFLIVWLLYFPLYLWLIGGHIKLRSRYRSHAPLGIDYKMNGHDNARCYTRKK